MRQLFPTGLLLLAAACGGTSTATVSERTVTEADLASLPELTVEDGTLLCTALGYDDCPLHSAVANRLDAQRIAIWEPGRTIRVWRAGDSMGIPIGRAGGDSSEYLRAMAIATDGSGYRVVTADSGWRLLRFNAEGRLEKTELLPLHQPMTMLGYVGTTPVRQAIRGWDADSAGKLTVTLLRRISDSVGTDVLTTPVPWMHSGSPLAPPLVPLITASPSWALETDGDIVWSPGSPFLVQRRAADGTVRWTLHGPAGPPVTDRELAIRDSVVRAASVLLPLEDDDFASMRDRSDTLHPAVTGLTVMPSGDILMARSVIPGRDSVEYLRLGPDGAPQTRFRLPERCQVLLAQGDSILVHRPTESEPWELRWLRLVTP